MRESNKRIAAQMIPETEKTDQIDQRDKRMHLIFLLVVHPEDKGIEIDEID